MNNDHWSLYSLIETPDGLSSRSPAWATPVFIALGALALVVGTILAVSP